MPDRITIQSSRCDNADVYHAYRQLKHTVFVIEQGWHDLADPQGRAVAIEDPFDGRGRYQLATNEAGEPVGVVRGVLLREGFPHQSLFAHHLKVDAFSRALPMLASINALAVLPAYRRQKYTFRGTNWKGSLGNLLLLSLLDTLASEGAMGAIATAGGEASLRFFSRFGFQMLDRALITPLHCVPFTNIGLIFNSPTHLRTQIRCQFDPQNLAFMPSSMHRLRRYFVRRQSAILEDKAAKLNPIECAPQTA